LADRLTVQRIGLWLFIVKVTCTRYERVTNGFVSFADAVGKGKEWQRQAADALKVAFAR
jgi:hypothetical protein